jgi:hypothetical protein
MMSSQKRQIKVVKNRFYIYKGEVLVRIISFNVKENRVVLYRYDKYVKEHIEYDTAPLFLSPLFKIGEVARFLQRSVETIRKYEQLGYIPKAKRFQISRHGNTVRMYNESDLMDLADFFATRSPPGRPEKTNSKIDRNHLIKNLEARFKDWRI